MITGVLSLAVIALIASVGLALTVFWIWMLISAIQDKGLSESAKIGWVLAIMFLHFIGSLLYFFIGHPKRHALLLAS